MPMWVYGTDAITGMPRDPLFVETDDEAVARAAAAEAGMVIAEVESRGRSPQPSSQTTGGDRGERFTDRLGAWGKWIARHYTKFALVGCVLMLVGALRAEVRLKIASERDQFTPIAMALASFGGIGPPLLALLAAATLLAGRNSINGAASATLGVGTLVGVFLYAIPEQNAGIERLRALAEDVVELEKYAVNARAFGWEGEHLSLKTRRYEPLAGLTPGDPNFATRTNAAIAALVKDLRQEAATRRAALPLGREVELTVSPGPLVVMYLGVLVVLVSSLIGWGREPV